MQVRFYNNDGYGPCTLYYTFQLSAKEYLLNGIKCIDDTTGDEYETYTNNIPTTELTHFTTLVHDCETLATVINRQ